ncbi:hypothetical protein G4D82_04745 [Flavobacterium sp. CYK-4]|uniref:hypothetical protein n=1 Tax=Flavobacterium lotistagni TaxID=2709660 RepID=UPI0014092FB8|nr:hypothetical protein [Flavobacterium lotistagni]NHM06520.1 hypothetical protein [Flavobacterium lotistagni]
MKPLFFLLLTLFGWQVGAQTQYLAILSETHSEQKTIDSIGYVKQHPELKSLRKEALNFSEKLIQCGYIESELTHSKTLNDSTSEYYFRVGKKVSSILVYIGKDSPLRRLSLFDSQKDTLTLPYNQIENFLQKTLNQLEKKGFALSKLQLVNIRKKDQRLIAELSTQTEIVRHLDDIVINGYDKFPDSHKQNLKRLYKKKVFNQDNLKNIYSDIEKFRFVKQTKYPEILFKTDSTKIYVYLEKVKSNNFDGFIGFSNDEEKKKVTINGYLDLTLNNLMNTGETFSLYWKSDGNDQKTFNAKIQLPYIFKSPFGLKAQLNIFKQDSTFQNTQTAIDLGYFFNYNTRLYLGYQSAESSDIQNQNTISISDYNNSFVTTQLEFIDFKPEEYLFAEKTKIDIKLGVGSRKSKFEKNDQLFLNVNLKQIFFLNSKNNISVRSQNYYLNSDAYIVNELYRFGGINSIRGFNENSLQGNTFSSLLTEYRYLVAQNLYVHTIMDYGYYTDKTTNSSGSLIGLGLGFGLATKNGLFNIVYANGSTKEQEIKGANSIVHVSFKTTF